MDQLDDALDILDRSVAAAPYDVWTLGQLVSVLNDIGHFGSAARLARRAVALDPEDPATWSGLGWALQYGSPPDLAAAEDAYRQAWNRQPKDQPDPWVLSGIADTYHLRGDVQRAAADYERALEIADRGRTLNRAMVSVVGWCQFRLGDLDNATRAFLESSSMETLPGSDGFDLALAMLCDGRHKRAEAAYTEAVARVEERHPLRRRGYLAVGLADLRQARADYRDLRDHEAAAKIEGVLLSALNALPPLPDLRTTRLLDEPYSPPHH
jgi:tetratricopeptide (TPR) repeat protein